MPRPAGDIDRQPEASDPHLQPMADTLERDLIHARLQEGLMGTVAAVDARRGLLSLNQWGGFEVIRREFKIMQAD